MTGYVLDSAGNLIPIGEAQPAEPGRIWEGLDLMRSLTVIGQGKGYVLDGWGGVFGFGGAPRLWRRAVWPGLDTARDIGLLDPERGYVLDSHGGIHPLGDADRIDDSPRSSASDAVALHLIDDEIPSGLVLFENGRIEGFGIAPSFPRPALNEKVVDFVVINDDPSGYLLTSAGDIVSFGGAPETRCQRHPSPAIGLDWSSTGGYVLFSDGYIAELGDSERLAPVSSPARLVDLALGPRS